MQASTSQVSTPDSSHLGLFLNHPIESGKGTVVEAPFGEESIKMINKRLKEEHPHHSLNAFILATDGTHSQVLLRLNHNSFPEDIEVANIFPNGALSYRIFNWPCTRTRNVGDWRLFLSNDKAHSPRNMAVQAKFGREWFGNIILVKYGTVEPGKLENVEDEDRAMAYSLLNALFIEFSAMRDSFPEYKISGPRTWRNAGFNIFFM